MPLGDSIKNTKDVASIVSEVMKVAGESPDVRAAGGELGKTSLTVTKTINNALLPLAAINFAFDKARTYFADRFAKDMAEKVASVPSEQVVEPKASIAGPALQGLAFSHEEPDLRAMYLSLLGSAMDGRAAARVHPAFVEIIRQLDAEEAKLIGGVLASGQGIAVAEVRLTVESGWQVLFRHLLDLRASPERPEENPRLPVMVDNWVRLGLVTVEYDRHLAAVNAYAWVEVRPEFERLRGEHETEKHKLTFQKGLLKRTSLGVQFASVVGLLNSSSESSTAEKPRS